jgi:hypothetical protein
MLALVNNEENAAESYDVEADDLRAAAEGVLRLFDEIDSRIYDASLEWCVLIIQLTSDPSLIRTLQNAADLILCLRLPKFSKLKINILSQRVNTRRLALVFRRNRAICSMQWLRFHR